MIVLCHCISRASIVTRPKDFPHYIVLQASLELGAEHQALLAKLTEDQVVELVEELRVEMSRSKIGYSIDLPLKKVTLVRRIPITDDLTEDAFIQRIDEVQSDLMLARDTIVLGLDQLSKEHSKS